MASSGGQEAKYVSGFIGAFQTQSRRTRRDKGRQTRDVVLDRSLTGIDAG